MILRHKDKNTISVSVMNIYLFLIYSLFSLIYLYISTIAYTIMLMPYTLIQSYTPLFFSISLIKPYLFITFSLPFYSLSQGLIRYTTFIVPSHFSSFSYFHYILLSSLSYCHLILSDPKGYTGLFPYRYYLCSIQPWHSSISRRPACTISLSFNLI